MIHRDLLYLKNISPENSKTSELDAVLFKKSKHDAVLCKKVGNLISNDIGTNKLMQCVLRQM